MFKRIIWIAAGFGAGVSSSLWMKRVVKKRATEYTASVATNFIENSEDFVKKFSLYENILHHNNKIIISSINSKWNFIVSILSSFKIIKSEIPKNYISKKTIENTFIKA